ncbi:long-chain-fatty-acid--CoA ligase 6-like isoform X5 [Dinothrombium tinctorium]|uniref:Long-chain-fatty-acid--CoA ligase n=1 Tax=Dinothrombium tinctorium TaxID=1965070 RepID=A0A3S4QYF4_9ACAR|nr:long-chain-fatty-acid--CoA ligase 6-like isoform X5 [Dinothrombium tinctorium]
MERAEKANESWLSLTLSLAVGAVITSLTFLYMSTNKALEKIKLTLDLNKQSDQVSESTRKSLLYHTSSEKDCMRRIIEHVATLYDCPYNGIKETPNGDCLGKIDVEKKKYEWLKYEELLKRSKNFGAGLVQLGLSPGSKTNIGMYSKNCVEYTIAEYGCYHQSMVFVPLYDTFGPNACTFCINQAEISCVCVDSEIRLEALMSQAEKTKSLKYVITFDKVLESYRSKAVSFGIKCYHIDEIEKMGEESALKENPPKPSDVAVVCYTSGTTGDPKGVVLTHENVMACIAGVMFQLGEFAPNKEDTMISFLPLSHMFERCCEAACLMVGARVGYTSGDIKRLSEDFKILQPTISPVVPRVLNRIYDAVMTKAKANKITHWLLKKALASKQNEIDNNIVRNNSIWDKLVFNKIRHGMGGRIRLMVVGSAPLTSDVLNFMRCALGCIICEGYGQTECVCCCNLTIPGDGNTGHVGPPVASVYIKLVDVPDMDYYVKKGSGEICVRGTSVFQGYYKDPTKTAEALDKEGWLHTGDIGTWLENGTLRIIDRKKHLFKLSQGEYISPERVESIYVKSDLVSQVYIYGDSYKSSVVAIVVPEKEVLSAWARKNEVSGPLVDVCKDERARKAVLDDMRRIGTIDGLRSFEQAKAVFLTPEPFTIENGLLTPTMKTKREECRKVFKAEIDEIKLHEEVMPHSLAFVRIVFGFLMIIDTINERGLCVADHRWGDALTCRFPLFNFIKLLPLEWMCFLYFLMLMGALGMMIGMNFKCSCIMYLLPYVYMLLLEKSYWNNHSYLFALLAMIFTFSEANAVWLALIQFSPLI